MNFLVTENLLDRHEKKYSNKAHFCYSYRLSRPYFKHRIRAIEVKGNKLFIERRLQERNNRMELARISTDHLTKWLDPNRFEVDYEEAMSMISMKYPETKDNQKSNQRIRCIESINNGRWGYSREGKDNRLHSILTCLSKDLRKYIKYDGRNLISIDIKNSQPFVFSSVLRNLDPLSDNHICKILENYNLIPNMFYGFYSSNSGGDLERFIGQVEDGTIYERYYEVLYNAGLVFRNCCGTFSYEEQTFSGARTIKFEKSRDLGKDIIMKTLFSSLKNSQEIVRIFKSEYPSVYRIMQKIKGTKAHEKNYFAILLQNIEADCILDYCTKKISSDHPNIPLFTIHDSIVTTEENIEIVEHKFKEYLGTYFGTIPKLKNEPWCNFIELVA